MWGNISPSECSALYELVADSPRDTVVTTDRHGRVVHASAGCAGLGLAFAGDPVGRHLLELLHPACAEQVLAEHAAAIAGRRGSGWIEVLATVPGGREAWLEMKLGPRPEGLGALGILRSIEDRRMLEDRLFVAAMTDPLTRLTNREAFTRMLDHLVESGRAGHIALFDLDHFRRLNLRHGHSGGDRVLIAFAGLLRTLLRADDILSRVGGGTFGVLLPEASEDQALRACERVIASIGELEDGAGPDRMISASAGLARFAGSADATLRNAELALIAAKARGRACVVSAARGRVH